MAIEDDPLNLESWPSELDRDAVGAALDAFAEVIGEGVDCELVITSDFEGQVRNRMEREVAAAYFQDRGDYGTAMAKTLWTADGRASVVFDVRVFAFGATQPAAATFRHEALHVLLGREGERTFDSRGSLAERSGLSPDLVAMAGVAVEEYRVQLATYDRFPDDPWQSFPALCTACHDSIHKAAVDYYWDPAKDVQPFRIAVLTALAAMSTQAGYVAAQLQLNARSSPALQDEGLDERMLGEPFRQVIASLRELPSAEHRVGCDELDAAVLRVTGLLTTWLRHIGFEDERLELDRGTFFHVYEHEDWVLRGAVGVRHERR